MIIKSNCKNYEVLLEQDFNFMKTLLEYENTFFVIDKNVYELYKNELFASIPGEKLYIFEALEKNKTIESALNICEILTGLAAKRNIHMVSFGGGIVQDVTGFVANVLYRGIHWTFVPTTLLAACDSCIGSKTSLNYKHFKNLLGTFYPPDNIYICSRFFKTLSEKDFESGLGEVIKFNVMIGKTGLERIEKNIKNILQRDQKKLDEFVLNSLSFKKDFIEEDEFDRGIRIHLNFAHTFGHAFESLTDYAIPHGTAVAMGMIVANRISLARGYIEEDLVVRVEKILRKIIHVDSKYLVIDMDNIIGAIKKDKKQTSPELTAVLMYDEMKLKMVKDVKPDEIEKAIIFAFNLIK